MIKDDCGMTKKKMAMVGVVAGGGGGGVAEHT